MSVIADVYTLFLVEFSFVVKMRVARSKEGVLPVPTTPVRASTDLILAQERD